ncbi:hypothetical protein ACFW1M_38495 [Streptomyces inhibens]|uniref:hypothetical protein n=1 Tax=Streptomyces inhibens TaxID=2293571 RepID=UPI0036C5100E
MRRAAIALPVVLGVLIAASFTATALLDIPSPPTLVQSLSTEPSRQGDLFAVCTVPASTAPEPCRYAAHHCPAACRGRANGCQSHNSWPPRAPMRSWYCATAG